MSIRLLADRYELLEKIGDGGMAVVYKARCRLLNRFVAVKILKPEFTRDLKIMESFRRESQAAASLSHPNIVNVYDVGKEGNISYIVMELVEGRVLSDIIKEDGPMDYKRAVEVGIQIASALSLAHKNHIIHRDVKPHNILITSDGIAKITDFGIAKAMDSTNGLGNSETVMGSVHYISPEQARGGYIDEKSDIYSLGIVLYELVTGKVPFDAENPVEVALMHINGEIIPPTKIDDSIPTVVENIIMKATNKYSINRYASADQMLEALKNSLTVANIFGSTEASQAKSNTIQEMEKDLKEKKKTSGKKRLKLNWIKLGAAILAIGLAIPASSLIFSGISSLGAGKSVEVPNVTGMTYQEAKTEIEGAKLTIKKGDEVIDYDYPSGDVVSQLPKEGESVKEGSQIFVSISKGAKTGTIPNIVGKSFQDAVFLLERYGYSQGVVTVEESNMPKDIVIRQSPEQGTDAKPVSAISIVVSEGPKSNVPNLVGLTLEEAIIALEEQKLLIGDIEYEMSEVYASGVITWQQELAPLEIVEGTKVNIKISTGNDPAGSKSIPLDIDYSRAVNQVFYLTVTVNDESGTNNIISKEQRIKENGSEIISLYGVGEGTVTVIFDNDVVMQKSVNFNTGTIE